MRALALIATALLLGGCLQSNTRTEDFYTLDSRYLILCRGASNNCLEMSLIASGINRADAIEQAYGQKVKGPNYPLSLARMLMKPADDSYAAQALDENGRYYSLPVNSKTDIVWNTLDDIYGWIYDDK